MGKHSLFPVLAGSLQLSGEEKVEEEGKKEKAG